MKATNETAAAAAGADQLLAVGAVAALLALSVRTCWKFSHTGRLPKPVKIGRAVRWRLSDLQRFIRTGCTTEGGR